MKTQLFLLLTVLLLPLASKAQGDPIQSDSAYFGLTPPGATPELFAPGIVSLPNRHENGIVFSPDGTECYFTERADNWFWTHIKGFQYTDTGWVHADTLPMPEELAMAPSFTHDGNKVYYVSYNSNYIYRVFERSRNEDGSWSARTEMPVSISSGFQEYSCHVSNLGNMFVCSWRAGGTGGCDGWKIPYVDGAFQQAESLGNLNSQHADCVWMPGDGEEFLIFQSNRDPDGGDGAYDSDLYITFKDSTGDYAPPINLGSTINSDDLDACAWITYDQKYLFFSSDRAGTEDIYWVSLDSILAEYEPNNPILHAESPIKQDFMFYQNFPNPFYNVTTLQFKIEKPGKTEMTVYDLAGRKMETIYSAYTEAGNHQLEWHGAGYRKGEYLCTLTHSNSTGEQLRIESTILVLLR